MLISHNASSVVINKAEAVCTNECCGLLIGISSLGLSPADWLLLLKVVIKVLRKKEGSNRLIHFPRTQHKEWQSAIHNFSPSSPMLTK